MSKLVFKSIDLPEVLERVQDDRELLLELFDIFQTDFEEKRKEIEEFLKQKNFSGLRDIIHSVKGAAGNISAKPLHVICSQIEAFAERQELSEINATMPGLDKEYAQLLQDMDQIRKQFKKG